MIDLLWQAKLAAWIHDPAEKALVLLRDPAGHEGGTAKALRQRIFQSDRLPDGLQEYVKQADRWAAAADRPQWPQDGQRFATWTQVRFDEQPVLIHPLSGENFNLGSLKDLTLEDIKTASFNHFKNLIVSSDSGIDERRTALAFWRFGPELGQPYDTAKLGELWGLLPADTRVPDHTIWNHLDLTSAFASAFALDPQKNPALLAMSFGPVQDFIAQARTTSDLWAGSHLLSRLAWQALKVICAELGPDAVIFPQLRGVPQVDLWLLKEMGLPARYFDGADWLNRQSDANPLFSAALPNKFVAIVPAARGAELADKITAEVRRWVKEQTETALAELLDTAGLADSPSRYAREQITAQLENFPEVHWALVPFAPLAREIGSGVDTTELETAQAPFRPPFRPAGDKGFLNSDAWKLLSREITVDGARFYRPNAGVLYPALYDLLDRVQAAAKAVRSFTQLPQTGYRCSLCGEREWLTTDRDQLALPPGERKERKTVWFVVAEREPSWARKGEHLCAPCTLKRLWPTLFVHEIEDLLDQDMRRYVVSTHTMALATTLERWLNQSDRRPLPDTLSGQLARLRDAAVLPRKLAVRLRREDHDADVLARKLPVYLDNLRDSLGGSEPHEQEQAERALASAETDIKAVFGAKPEAYYALIMLDGDNMGAWLSGKKDDALEYQQTWHPQIRQAIAGKFQQADLQSYAKAKRPVSPARHIAISSALNSFALHLAPYIVETVCKGKLIYAGGDDVLAMVSVDDLLPALLLLRLVYSGLATDGWERLGLEPLEKLQSKNGHVLLRDRLYRVMGNKATASAGAVIAHHSAPLGAVLRQLRDAEKQAKNRGGRNAFAIRVLKRSGGMVELVSHWFGDSDSVQDPESTPIGMLLRLREALANPQLSRRVAYLAQSWLPQLPPPGEFSDSALYEKLLADNLAWQFARQCQRDDDKQRAKDLGRGLGKLAVALAGLPARPEEDQRTAADLIHDFLAVAEFLAREGRVDNKKELYRHD